MKKSKLFKKISINLILLITLTLIYRCNIKVGVLGYPQEIFVVTDSLLWLDIGPQINEVFESLVYTPTPEPSFSVTWIPLANLNDFKNRMNVFLVGVASDDNETTKYLNSFLPDNFKSGVMNDQNFYFFSKNLYAEGQINLVIYAKDRNSLKVKFNQFSQDIFNSFSKKYFDRLTDEMFKSGEQKELEKIVRDKFGWKIRIQHDYFIATEDINKKYVWLRRMDPDRWLSIWQMAGDSTDLQLDSLTNMRDKILGKHYQGDRVDRDETYLTNVTFSGHPAVKVVGIWQNDSLFVGGPFRLYAYLDPVKSQIYYVDIAVMAPNKQKKPFLDQLEVIANTFGVADSLK